MARSGMLQTTQFAYRKGRGISDALLCVSYGLQSALKNGQVVRTVQIDLAQPFIESTIMKLSISSVLRILEVLCCTYILTQFLINRSQHVMVTIDGVNWLTLV